MSFLHSGKWAGCSIGGRLIRTRWSEFLRWSCSCCATPQREEVSSKTVAAGVLLSRAVVGSDTAGCFYSQAEAKFNRFLDPEFPQLTWSLNLKQTCEPVWLNLVPSYC